jgi:hypothetical protein
VTGVRFRVQREPHFKRRRRAVGAFVAGVVVAVFVAQGVASRSSEPLPSGAPPVVRRADPSNPIVIENRRPGTPTWRIGREAGSSLQGFAGATSIRPGNDLPLYVNTRYRLFSVRVFRMGWYGGDQARLVWFRRGVPGTKQPPATVDRETNMVETDWTPSLSIPVGDDWTTGAYLVKLVAPEGQASFVPFTVREGEHRAPIVFQSSVTTWQAYNKWGGHSLYLGFGPDGREMASKRAVVVSFDRPYSGAGASDFLGLELPLISWLEEVGYDVGYATDIDTHADPDLLRARRAFLSLGHDEYWSTRMRNHVEEALDSGVNLAFFGANAMFRHIRLERSPIGPHRREVNYRSAITDPITDTDPSQATVSWRDPPLRKPEDAILGAMYECNPVKGDLVVRDATTWLFDGTALSRGDRITGLLGPEYDRVFPNRSHPERIWVLFRTPVFCGGASSVQDTTFARFPSGAGVFNAATSNFLCAFHAGCEGAPADERIQRLVRNLMDVYLGLKTPTPEPDPQPFSVSESRVGQVIQRSTRPTYAATPTPYPYGPRTPQSPTYYTPAPGYTSPPSTPQPRRPRLFP